jgi:predicted acylesterase/phospholipase RssA
MPFKIGINMAGAISAGAYTAGVLDFLTEALDEWYAAKTKGEAVPMHDVMIEVFSGASAGGMCAAISSAMLYQNFQHIHDVNQQNTNNIFYESWVNKIDIVPLLNADDLSSGKPVVSLLNSRIIDQIAAYALKPTGLPPVMRPYVSPTLTLFLSLTNLRGVPYSLNGAAPGSIEETTFFYGDRIRFQTISNGGSAPLSGCTRGLDLNKAGAAGGWDVLQTAAMATGAFPVFLAPRILDRKLAEYIPPGWESVISAASGTPPPIPPNIPPGAGDPFVTLNVDGGVTNNDPYNYSHDYLLALDPPVTGGKLLQDPLTVDRAVVGIAPFPTTDAFDPKFNAQGESAILSALPKLFDALVSQARFFGESLSAIMNGVTFDRFVIAPSDDKLVEQYRKSGDADPADQPTALQCATLGAFGGFFHRGFRAHDYALGRRNCQKFLRDYFVLPGENAIMKQGLGALDETSRDAVIKKFHRPAPGKYGEPAAEIAQSGGTLPAVQRSDREWLPIIPLCGSAVPEVPHPVRDKISKADVDRIVGLVSKRLFKLGNVVVSGVEDLLLRLFLLPGPFFISWLGKPKIKRAIINGLGDSYQG